MSGLIQRSRVIRPRRGLMRSWLALWLQERRRKRAVVAPNAPIITGYSWVWDQTEPGWVDVSLNFTFDHGTFPPAIIEVWLQKEGNQPAVLVGSTVSTDGGFNQPQATESEEFLFYTMRYVSGAIVGPFSNEMTFLVMHPPAAPSSLQAEGDNGGSAVLSWDMTGVDGEDGCSIEGRRGSDEFAEIGTTGANVGSWMGGLASGDWEFRVRAYNAGGFSDYSNTASATVM